MRTASESEEARYLVPEAVEALTDVGLLKMRPVRELGGTEASPATQMLVLAAIAEIDVSTAWNVMVNNNSTGFMSAFLSDEGVQEVFADGVPIAAGVTPATGRARKVEGGYIFDGRWKTCSGVRQASWVRLCGALDDGSGRTVHGVLPKAHVEIHDTWHVLGLRGTGSYDVSLTEYFVPDHRIVPTETRLRGGPQYRLGGVAKAAYEHTGIALGIGRRSLRELAALADRRGRPDHVITDLGRLTMALDAAEALAVSVQEHAYEVLSDDAADVTRPGMEGLAAATHVTEVALDCAHTAYRHAGTSGLYLPNSFERLLRDVLAAGQHIAVSPGNYRLLGSCLVAHGDAA
ncbi:acyl-CoA dehydrogenase family protein [Nonomuraea monospora]|uniref:Acyl-CoA dehydrogenase family protein n=1 Tax=Nonomuraea monospora TaxID=568818 RepID=A0ABP5PX28_9ACTN